MDVLQPLLAYYGIGSMVLRVVLGLIFIYHAAPKISNPRFMSQAIKWPLPVVTILGLVEVSAGGALVAGLFMQEAALALIVVMLGALYYKIFRWQVPFSTNKNTGWEFDLLILAVSVAILLSGGGAIGL